MKFDLIYPLKNTSWGPWGPISYQNKFLKRINPMIIYTKFDQNPMKNVEGVCSLFSAILHTKANSNGQRRIGKVHLS